MLVFCMSTDMIGNLLARERVFSSAKEMDGGAGEREQRLLGLAERYRMVMGVRKLVQSEGMFVPLLKWRVWLRL